jgi:hypothetical protein
MHSVDVQTAGIGSNKFSKKRSSSNHNESASYVLILKQTYCSVFVPGYRFPVHDILHVRLPYYPVLLTFFVPTIQEERNYVSAQNDNCTSSSCLGTRKAFHEGYKA